MRKALSSLTSAALCVAHGTFCEPSRSQWFCALFCIVNFAFHTDLVRSACLQEKEDQRKETVCAARGKLVEVIASSLSYPVLWSIMMVNLRRPQILSAGLEAFQRRYDARAPRCATWPCYQALQEFGLVAGFFGPPLISVNVILPTGLRLLVS